MRFAAAGVGAELSECYRVKAQPSIGCCTRDRGVAVHMPFKAAGSEDRQRVWG